jgi:two-component system response regulator NreC
MSIEILVVEDHPVVRLGLQMLLEPEPDIEIIAEAGTATEAIQLVDKLQPDVVLMDLGLPDGSGINATAEIKKLHPEVAVIALTIHEDHEYVDKMLAVGASGYVSKRAAPEDLLTAIRVVNRGQVYLHPTVITQATL